eukprot:TRINITY_DN4357_c0_g2_i2.p1 TRINITY_DN4357_c0_g2~~TRINITY_DN4357_c0_g2_i2.p1  ORF type:complete len:851 (+),score=209.35 TRINITY_DN4357_c0_g2_i2:453-3005(+)
MNERLRVWDRYTGGPALLESAELASAARIGGEYVVCGGDHEGVAADAASLLAGIANRPMLRMAGPQQQDRGKGRRQEEEARLASPEAPPTERSQSVDSDASLLSNIERGQLGKADRRKCQELTGKRVVGPLSNRQRIHLKIAHLRNNPKHREQFGRRARVYRNAVVALRDTRGKCDHVRQNISGAADQHSVTLPDDPEEEEESETLVGDGTTAALSTSVGSVRSGEVAFVDAREGDRIVFRRDAATGSLQCVMDGVPWRCPQLVWGRAGRDLEMPYLGEEAPAHRLRRRSRSKGIGPKRQHVTPPADALANILARIRRLAVRCGCAVGIDDTVKVAGAQAVRARRLRAESTRRAEHAIAVREALADEVEYRIWCAEMKERMRGFDAATSQEGRWEVAVVLALFTRRITGGAKAGSLLIEGLRRRNWAQQLLVTKFLPMVRQRIARSRLREGVGGVLKSTRIQVRVRNEMDRRKGEASETVRKFMVAIAGCVQMRARVAQVHFRRRLRCLQMWIRSFAQRKAFQLFLMDMQWRRLEAALAHRLRQEDMHRLRNDLQRFLQWRAKEKKVHGVLPKELTWREDLPWDSRTFRLLASMVEMRAHTLRDQDLRGIAADIGYLSRRHFHTQPSFRHRRLWEELTRRRRVLFKALPQYRDALHRWEQEREHLTRHISHDSAAAQETMLCLAHARPKPEAPTWSILIEPRLLTLWIREGWHAAEGGDGSLSPRRRQQPEQPEPQTVTTLRVPRKAAPAKNEVVVSRLYGGAAAVGPAAAKKTWSPALALGGDQMSAATARRALRAEAALLRPKAHGGGGQPRRPSSAVPGQRQLTPAQWAGRSLLPPRPQSAQDRGTL